ncbi:hypothetical protein L7F22_038165 [Adiantum nelumboides]|nr:hypothetical protein [Adiantum nelumboides]
MEKVKAKIWNEEALAVGDEFVEITGIKEDDTGNGVKLYAELRWVLLKTPAELPCCYQQRPQTMELHRTHETLLSPSLRLPRSNLPCLQRIQNSLSSSSSCNLTCFPCSSRRRYSSSIVAKAKQSESKSAPPPPRPELWELRDYEDPDEDEGSQEKKSKSRLSFETEAEARRHHWISRMWAPWEEALSPEARFAVDALNLDQGEEPIVTREMMANLDVNKPIIPDDAEILEDLDDIEARENGALPGTAWKTPMVFSLIPPRDWPPPGWKVDADELAFIRSIHGIMDTDIAPRDLSTAVPVEDNPRSHPRWDMFMKQYNEWVAANKERLDREAEEWNDEYYPGRRKMGEEYVEGMYELPFIYPGQHYLGQVTMVHLYEGAFVNFGAVHDGWVPIKRNDWYYLRKIIKVGMKCQVEVIAKRDPYRFRFPIELRFVQPNIDHLIFRRFDYPPIFVRNKEEEKNMDVINREAFRPLWPRRRPIPEEEDEPEHLDKVPKYNHPYSFKMDGYREKGSSSQDRQHIPIVHEVGEGSSQAEETFRMQLVNVVTLFKQLMENPRFMEFLQFILIAHQAQEYPPLSEHVEAQFQVFPPSTVHFGYFGGGSVFQSMAGYALESQLYMPGTVFGGMHDMVPNPMYADIGLQPGFQGTQGQFGMSQGNLGMASFSIPPVNDT